MRNNKYIAALKNCQRILFYFYLKHFLNYNDTKI